MEHGYTLMLREGYIFKKGNAMKAFSQHFIDMKDIADKTGDLAMRTTAKLMINAGYGKFGASYKHFTTQVTTTDKLTRILDLYKVHSIMELQNGMSVVYRDVTPKERVDRAKVGREELNKAFKIARKALAGGTTNVALASAITSLARIELYKLIGIVQTRGGRMMYTDTDRIFATLPENPFGKPFAQYV